MRPRQTNTSYLSYWMMFAPVPTVALFTLGCAVETMSLYRRKR
ncbi:hypothetical protein [Roseibium sp. RKSG952]|nr:hypothetical protein [Roseibium sp. RKSG952]